MAIGLFDHIYLLGRDGRAHEGDGIEAELDEVDDIEEAFDDEDWIGRMGYDVVDVEEVVVFFEVFREQVFGLDMIIDSSAAVGSEFFVFIEDGDGDSVFQNTGATKSHLEEAGDLGADVSFFQVWVVRNKRHG